MQSLVSVVIAGQEFKRRPTQQKVSLGRVQACKSVALDGGEV